MPALRIINYDLNKERDKKGDYEGFYAYFDKMKARRLSESSYVVETDLKPKAIYAALEPFIDENDHVLILTLTKLWWGSHSKKLIEWLQERLPVE